MDQLVQVVITYVITIVILYCGLMLAVNLVAPQAAKAKVSGKLSKLYWKIALLPVSLAIMVTKTTVKTLWSAGRAAFR